MSGLHDDDRAARELDALGRVAEHHRRGALEHDEHLLLDVLDVAAAATVGRQAPDVGARVVERVGEWRDAAALVAVLRGLELSLSRLKIVYPMAAGSRSRGRHSRVARALITARRSGSLDSVRSACHTPPMSCSINVDDNNILFADPGARSPRRGETSQRSQLRVRIRGSRGGPAPKRPRSSSAGTSDELSVATATSVQANDDSSRDPLRPSSSNRPRARAPCSCSLCEAGTRRPPLPQPPRPAVPQPARLMVPVAFLAAGLVEPFRL